MRKIILMESSQTNEMWPTLDIENATKDLYEYLQRFIPEKNSFTKHAINGPAGKLLSILGANKFGNNAEAYIGYITNIHNQTSKIPLNQEASEKLASAVKCLIEFKKKHSERYFLRILSAVDYGVYYLKVRQIAERSAANKEAGKA